ncbi:MAG: hypothetical protein H0X16_09840 [Chloroflexi bacterium]|nr:hypothetical protein [Chloroflexota bacterium]
MDARPFALAAGALLLAASLVWLLRDLRRFAAPRGSYLVGGLVYAAAATAWILAVAEILPAWVGWLATLPVVAATLLPRRLVQLTGGKAGPGGLLHDTGEIRLMLSTLTTSRLARSRLRARASQLDRWRTRSGGTAVDDLVGVVQDVVEERLEKGHIDPSRQRTIDVLEEDLRDRGY